MNVDDLRKLTEKELSFHICLNQLEMKDANERHWKTQQAFNEKVELKTAMLEKRMNEEKIEVLQALAKLEKLTIEKSHKNEIKLYSLSALFGAIMGFITSFFKFKS